MRPYWYGLISIRLTWNQELGWSIYLDKVELVNIAFINWYGSALETLEKTIAYFDLEYLGFPSCDLTVW